MTIDTSISLTSAFAAMSAGEAIAQEVIAPNKYDRALESGLGSLGA